MKIKKRFKKFISILFGCSLAFTSCLAFTPSTNSILASAETTLSIYDDPTANYFNADAMQLLGFSQDETVEDRSNVANKMSVSLNTDDGFQIKFLVTSRLYIPADGLTWSYCIGSGDTIVDLFPDLLNGETYKFSFVRTTSENFFGVGSIYPEVSLSFQKKSDDDTWLDDTFTMKYSGSYTCNFDNGELGDYSVFLIFNWKPEGSMYLDTDWYYAMSDIQINHGTTKQTYYEYFYKLNPPNTEETPPDSSETPDIGEEVPPADGTDIVEGSYDDGYRKGFNRGYNSGYADGLMYSKYSFFLDITLEVSVLNSNGSVTLIDTAYTPQYVSGGITLAPLIDYLAEKGYTASNCSGVRLSFYFSSPVVFEQLNFRVVGNTDAFFNTFKVYFVDNTSSFTGKFRYNDDIEGFRFFTSFSSVEEGKLYLQKTVSSFEDWDIYGLNNLQGLVMADYESAYYNGYESGKLEGLEEGESKGYSDGYNDGLVVGEGNGFNKGLAQGTSEDPYGLGDFVYTVIDMPGRFLANLLNFEFLGVNLAGLVTAVLSLLIIVFVVKKVT